MNLIIDGHNLVPFLPGLSLADADDELKLIKLLAEYARTQRAKIDVFFDQAAQGYSGSRSFGGVKAHFVRRGRTADEAIMALLNRLGRQVINYQVVTNDRMVIAAVKSAHAGHISSAGFANQILRAQAAEGQSEETEVEMSADEVAEWETLFKQKPQRKN